MDCKSLSAKKVKGVPVVWIVLVVAAAGLYGAFRLKSTPEDAPAEEDVPTGDDADPGQPTFTANPTGASPPPTVPAPASAPTGALGYQGPAVKQGNPPTIHTVKGKSDDTFAELGRLYYGLANWDTANLLRRANLTLFEPIPTGARVTIPLHTEPIYYVATAANRDLYSIARKNGTTATKAQALNPGKVFPVKVDTRVRVR